MAFTRFNYDDARTKKKLQEATDSGRYVERVGRTSNIHLPETSVNCNAESRRRLIVDCKLFRDPVTSERVFPVCSINSSTVIERPALNRIASIMVDNSTGSDIDCHLHLRLRINLLSQGVEITVIGVEIFECNHAITARFLS